MFVDTHTHLYAEEFNPDRQALIEKALANGIKKFYLPNIDSQSINGMLELETQFPGVCFPMIGLHPCHVNSSYEKELDITKY